MSAIETRVDNGVASAVVVMCAGISAALHVAKLFPALPALRDLLGVTLVQSGFLLSIVQLAGMTMGLVVGLLADGIGLKRCLVAGLLMLFGAGALGGWAQSATDLLALRLIEGAGFLLVCTPAPALIRQLVAPTRLVRMMGIWGTYMPLGTTLALLGGPALILLAGWQALWWLLSVFSLVMAVLVWFVVPAGDVNSPNHPVARPVGIVNSSSPSTLGGSLQEGWTHRLRQTLTSRGPWLIALSFAMYSSQWVSVIGFLPSIYAQAGFSSTSTAWLTALAAAVNVLGNLASGRLQGRNLRPQTLLYTGFCVMGLMTFVAFMPASAALSTLLSAVGLTGLEPVIRYLAILMFSMIGGMIPGTLFSLAVHLAPSKDTVSTTVGWMQQWSATGQFAGPPLVAWVASSAGGWQWTWLVTGVCSCLGLGLAWQIGRQIGHVKHAETI